MNQKATEGKVQPIRGGTTAMDQFEYLRSTETNSVVNMDNYINERLLFQAMLDT